MTKITLGEVYYYDIADIYSFEVDNRPLYNISDNINLLNNAISQLGFYQELNANPETEPVGGFSVLTCAYVGQNGLLYPIDISQSVIYIDYTKVPIYLITESLGSSKYKCLSFSASLTLSELYNTFLPSSIGNAIMVGPGGALVDELYFSVYYSAYGYQNIFVGKVLTPNTISFGGNQVGILGDNRFLSKNRNDSTTGLLTTYINNSISSVSTNNVLINTLKSSYPFIELVHQMSSADLYTSAAKVPVYFSSVPLTTTLNGIFTISNVESVLNEVHFASPVISANVLSSDILGTAGVNNRTLINFSQNYLLHSQSLSKNLNEISQDIGTSLVFTGALASSTNGLFVKFDSTTATFGSAIQTTTSVPDAISSAIQAIGNGIVFGAYKSTGVGAGISYISNNNLSTLTYVDTGNLYSVAALVGSSALGLTNKNASGNAIISLDTDYIILNTSIGAYYPNTATLPYEITNKLYVDGLINAVMNTADSMIPLAGTTIANPITGGLYMDLTSSSSGSTAISFNSLLSTNLFSSNPVSFQVLGSSGTYQVVKGATPQNVDGLNALVTAEYVAPAMAAFSSFSATSFVNISTDQSIAGTKTFTGIIASNSITPITFAPPLTGTDNTPIIINCDTVSNIIFQSSSTSTLAPLRLLMNATPLAATGEDPTTLATIAYVTQALESSANTILGPFINATWANALVNRSASITYSGFTWFSATPSLTPTQATSNFSTYFTYITMDGTGGGGYYTFNGIPNPNDPTVTLSTPLGIDPLSATFLFTVTDSRISVVGDTSPYTDTEQVTIYVPPVNASQQHQQATTTTQTQTTTTNEARTETLIAVVPVGTLNIIELARNIDASPTPTRVGSSCSITWTLTPGDKIYLLTQDAEYASASITRIR